MDFISVRILRNILDTSEKTNEMIAFLIQHEAVIVEETPSCISFSVPLHVYNTLQMQYVADEPIPANNNFKLLPRKR